MFLKNFFDKKNDFVPMPKTGVSVEKSLQKRYPIIIFSFTSSTFPSSAKAEMLEEPYLYFLQQAYLELVDKKFVLKKSVSDKEIDALYSLYKNEFFNVFPEMEKEYTENIENTVNTVDKENKDA